MSTDDRMPKRLFVSHISEEGEVAALLKQTIEDDFLGLVKMFASSDIGSIGAGKKWLEAVQQALEQSSAVVVLCSKASVARPWVQFELGAAWVKGTPTIPVCHSGMKVADLQMPLSLYQGVELGSESGLRRLYLAVAEQLGLARVPPLSDMAGRLARIAALEERFRRGPVQQFERYIDILIPAPGRLADETIPANAAIESDDVSLQLFGFLPGVDRTWKDILQAARRTPDMRWVGQLQRCIYQASNDLLFRPVQAVFHAEGGSYQPQLSKKEVTPSGGCRFHVHFVDTVVAPLSEVQNEFGLLATLLRLGLRFRYEVIERFQRLARTAGGGQRQSTEEVLRQLRAAVEVIENDALSRGAENIDRDAVAGLFDTAEDQDMMADIGDQWDAARALLFRTDPPLTAQDLAEIIKRMRQLNYHFMDLGTRRFHDMVHARWSLGPEPYSRAA